MQRAIEPSEKIQKALKRILDVTLAVICIVFLWPLFFLIAAAIRLDSPGPIIYRHNRVGKDGKSFKLLKFRSMLTGSDDSSYMQYLTELIQSERSEDGKAMPYRKLGVDPRITRVGKFIRTFYLDELPQVINILKGDMSFVGPRPHVQFEVNHYTPEQRRRLSTRPGATGLWQVTGKADCSFSELIDLDLQYIDKWSLTLDIKILLQTAMLVAKGGEGFWARMAKRIPKKRTRKDRKFVPNTGPSLIEEVNFEDENLGEIASPRTILK